MKWERGHRSEHVDDLRGQRPGGSRALSMGGGSIVTMIIIAVVAKALGVPVPLLGSILGGAGGTAGGAMPADPFNQGALGGGSQAAPPPSQTANDPDKEMFDFSSFVLDDVQKEFANMFTRAGKTYEAARLKIFSDAVNTGCGMSSSAVGPFYCPPDRSAYIDLSFYRELKQRFGAPGDFAQAYVLAHEIGHHLQTILGISEKVSRSARNKQEQNALSVRQELQADCFAGVWGKSAHSRGLLEKDDVPEAIRAAQAIGDDRLQKQAGVDVNPETWTHGSSEQRVRWFMQGFDNGTLESCDTFSVKTI